MQRTHDLNVISTVPLVAPREIIEEQPLTEAAAETVVKGRDAVRNVLAGTDHRVLVAVGPCSIHDENAAYEFAERLLAVTRKVSDRLAVVMRVYFEKPRTTVGWKGLINDPRMDNSYDIATGLRRARAILLKINEMGLPAGTEMLDPITPQYIADLVAWASIGARTTESQTHRQMASGLSMPVGFKNATDGNIQIAIDALQAAGSSHSFLGIDYDGRTCVVKTRGNPHGHLVLRGGRSGPNFNAENIDATIASCSKAGIPARIMVDCSHANSNKDYQRQEEVWRNVIGQITSGREELMGLMLESNLEPGAQKLSDPRTLKYGQSVTDPCLGWEKTEELLYFAHDALAGSLT